MDPSDADVLRELGLLRDAVRNLTERVYHLEQSQAAAQMEVAPSSFPVEPPAAPTASPQPAQWQPLSTPTTVPTIASTTAPAPPAAPQVTPSSTSAPTPGAGPSGGAVQPPRVSVQAPHRDLESQIGSHWLNRIGITAMLIGASYFLKYAFDNNWIGPAGRVAIGLLAGIAVVVWSEWFRGRDYKAFSYSLKAVGIGILYLSLWAAFQVYGLIPSGLAFFAMFLVTAATAVMAWSQDAEILAAFALTGGFATPLLLSTGQNREPELFAYVALLDFGALALVIFRPWRRLLLMSFAGTLLLYVAWDVEYYHRSEFTLTAFFATLFFLIFAIAPIIAKIPRARPGTTSPLPMFLGFVNAGVYFLQMYTMLEQIDKTASAWVALGLAAFYIYLSKLARERYSEPNAAQTLHLMHLALAIGFITIAIPIYLNSHWITMGWFVEAGVLLWVAGRLKSDLLNGFALAALVLGVARLLAFDDFDTTQVIFNARMATYLVAIVVLGFGIWQGLRRGDEAGAQAAAFGSVALNVLALWALGLEIHDYYGAQMTRQNTARPGGWQNQLDIGIARDFTYSALGMAYGAMLMVVGFVKRSAFIRWQALILIAVTICKVFVYDTSSLDRVYRIVSFMVLGALLLGISFVYQRDWLKLSNKSASKTPPSAT